MQRNAVRSKAKQCKAEQSDAKPSHTVACDTFCLFPQIWSLRNKGFLPGLRIASSHPLPSAAIYWCLACVRAPLCPLPVDTEDVDGAGHWGCDEPACRKYDEPACPYIEIYGKIRQNHFFQIFDMFGRGYANSPNMKPAE